MGFVRRWRPECDGNYSTFKHDVPLLFIVSTCIRCSFHHMPALLLIHSHSYASRRRNSENMIAETDVVNVIQHVSESPHDQDAGFEVSRSL